ncbi:hypothetical protein KAH43_01365, partial [Candidatus Bipolaricaulota bacterium]|nr:hypothetical protein [Candidatus Bipolaricaulota bacterium]
TWDPAPLCNPQNPGDPGTPPGGSSGESADLVITMNLADPTSEPVSDDSKPQYNLTVWNNGPNAARNVVLKLIMPPEVVLLNGGLSPIYTGTHPPNDIIEWHIGDKPVPDGKGVWLQADIDAGFCGNLVYQFEVSSDTPDPDMSNNSDTLTTQVGPCDGGGTPPGGEGEPSGACCLPNGQCIETGITDCDTRGGEYRGEGSSCEGSDCPAGSSEEDCPYISASVDEVCYDYPGPNESLLVRTTFSINNFGTAAAQTPWFEAEATYEITEGETTITYKDTYTGYAPDIPAGGSTSVTHEFNLGLVPQEPTDGVMVHVLSRINSPCIDYDETTGTNFSTLRCPSEDDGTGEPGEPAPEPEPTLLPNLWVTNMSGCWTWSNDGQEHVIATVTGSVHNGGQAD